LLLRGRSKIDILVEDLRFLGDSLSAIDALEHCGELPALETRTQVLGSMYVVEGSTLGGQLLRRHFAERFGFESQGARYFTGYGERTGPMWKQFGEVVNAIPAAEEDEAIYAACQTFSVMHRWLCTTKASA
jgi:heme oxygenase